MVIPTDIVSQFSGLFGQLLSFIFFIILISLYSRIMVQQVMFRLEKSANLLESYTLKAEKTVLKKIKSKPDKTIRKKIRNFLEFFMIPPVDLDPYGIIKKLEHLVEQEKYRFRYFVNQIAPSKTNVEQENLVMGLSGVMNLYQITKIVRHFVELIRKTKAIQLAFFIQMQLPLIERMSEALVYGTEALTNGWPIGDAAGPYVAAKLIGPLNVRNLGKETVICRKKYKRRDVIIMKAKGPGGNTGETGKYLDKIASKEKIAKIITIDAAAKLEGETTGTVAEGIGVAMGGIGVERSYIENIAVKKKILIDSVIIKMSQEEAIMPMNKAILKAMPTAINLVNDAIERTESNGKIIIVGVGNTSGVGNDNKNLKNTDKVILRNYKKLKKMKEAKSRGHKISLPFFDS